MIKKLLARRRVWRETKVINALRGGRELSAWQLAKATGLTAASVAGVLVRLEAQKVITSRWAVGPYPRRRMYRLAGTCWCCRRTVRPLDEDGTCGFCGVNRSERNHVGDEPCNLGRAS